MEVTVVDMLSVNAPRFSLCPFSDLLTTVHVYKLCSYLLGRIAMRNIRCGLLLLMFHGLSVGHDRDLCKNG